MLLLCKTCNNKKLAISGLNSNEVIFYNEWISTKEEQVNKLGKNYALKAMTKQKITATTDEILTKTNKEIPKYLEQLHNIHNQYISSKKLKENLDDKTAISNGVFAENYSTKWYTEIL